ncbi:hypothetical protein CONLIGDRAFT_708664 [Coniochaeta ligniaria NRRL 30616]|uniref:Gag1-like clamp domain-containing protein n=1 Tax=Coniochaeta ligniaria NRRL 30616 TaxID=1408157 RepID=A0A1J7J7T1_9PEZI|nr:hypothetical protein CONLIGDRAFT_708664 [Coniochaeta ligniaria NRRL 30616]
MLFSDLYKNPRSPLSKLRHSLPHPIPILPPGLDEDLVSRDKVKQKEAVKRFLADRIRCDWEFNWPPQQHSHNAEQIPDAKTASAEFAPTGSISASAGQVEPNNDLDPTAVKAAADAAPVPSPAPNSGGISPVPTAETRETEFVPQASGDEADSESDTESVYSTVSEDAAHYRPRADWTSDLSDNDAAQQQPSNPVLSPFRFDSPDSVGAAVQSAVQARRARRRREVREESGWNNGLACYNARRDAWTGARTVRVRPRATPVTSPTSPISPRRLFWRTHSRTDSASSTSGGIGGAPLTSVASAPAATTTLTRHTTNPLSPTTTHASNHSSTLSSEPADQPPCHRQLSSTSTTNSPYPVETLLPLPPPLIPPQNPMRASITPQIYPSLYDKVVVHSLQPSCPINLSDMVASCVAGWKRDGEWPPRSAVPPPPPPPPPAASGVVVVRRKRSEAAAAAAEQQQQHRRKGSAAAAGAANGEKGRRMSFGFLGRGERKSEEGGKEEKEREEESGSAGKGTGIRRSLQKVFLGLGHHHGGDGDGEHQGVKEGTVVV